MSKAPLWSRRAFTKTSLLALAAIACNAKALALVPGVHAQQPNSLSLLNIHTGERFAGAYRTPDGKILPDALSEFDCLLRCHYTDEIHPIDVAVLDYLAHLDQQLGGGNTFHIISGYRSPLYNEKLSRTGNGVASKSLHLSGRALDVRLPQRPLDTLHRSALELGLGGVGYYPRSNFVHLDSGPYRSW